MRGLINWEPRYGWMDELLESYNPHTSNFKRKETVDGYRYEILAPALDKSKLKLSVQREGYVDCLQLVYTSTTSTDGMFKSESFDKRITLPNDTDVDTLDATYKDGIIIITIDKGKKLQGKEIKVR